ncbi:hypothetical protein [Streptomyces sp. NPDC002640]
MFLANVRWLARYRYGRCGRESDIAERLGGVGGRVRFAGQVQAVLAVSARAVTLPKEDDSLRDVPLAVLLGDEGGSGRRRPS